MDVTPADAEIVKFAARQFLKRVNRYPVTPPIAKAAKKRISFSTHDHHSLSRVVCFNRHIVGISPIVQCSICMADLPEMQGRLTIYDR